jgi:phosphomannomutase
MVARAASERRQCPGEHYEISVPICRMRQRNQYPKCLLCAHRDPEAAGSTPTDPKVPSPIFRASAVIGRVPQEVNDYVVRKIGLAAAQLLRAEDPASASIAIGCDARENSGSFARAFGEGVNRGGMDTVNVGTVPPEVLAFVLGTNGCAGGAFIGGGNYAETVNGVRLWRGNGQLLGIGTGLEKVGLIARRMRLGCSRLPGSSRTADPVPDYVSYVAKFAPNLGKLKLVVDGGGGAAGPVARRLLSELSVEARLRNCDERPRGSGLGVQFPSEGAVAEMAAAMKGTGMHCGAAFDFNGERAVFFDERGRRARNDVVAGLIATEMLARNPGGTVTFDLRSTAMLAARIRQAGGQPVSAPTGRLAFSQHFRRNDALYGADADAGHYFRDFFRFRSPFLALLVIGCYLARERRPMSELVGELDRLPRSGEVAIPLPSADAAEPVLTRVRDEFQAEERELIDGLTVRTQDWWFNLRQPGRASELRLNVEGKTARDVRRAQQTVEKLVHQALATRP